MPTPDQELIVPPYTAFNFKVEIDVPDLGTSGVVCSAAFSECTGLEMTMTPKTIREGGNNTRPIHLLGPVAYSQLTLKRGMTANYDLWRWFNLVMQRGKARTRGTSTVVMLANDRVTVNAEFVITGCLPVKLRAPVLNAESGIVAVEELQMAYETLRFVAPGGA